jgi:hypothetical protein
MIPRLSIFAAALIASGVTALLFPASTAHAAAFEPAPKRDALTHAEKIRLAVDARYRQVPGRKLAVTEATTTSVIESFTLLSADLQETRVVPADNGIYFAICPRAATCPYPATRFARPAADFLPRRLALELALRTLLETSAEVVAVSLPTPRFVLVIVERSELAREPELLAFAETLRDGPARALAPRLQQVVDSVTRTRTFVALGLEPTPSGRDTLGAIPRWPTFGHAGANDASDKLAPRKLAATRMSTYEVPALLNEVAHVYSLGGRGSPLPLTRRVGGLLRLGVRVGRNEPARGLRNSRSHDLRGRTWRRQL